MNLNYSPSENTFRMEARTWLDRNAPRTPRPPGDSSEAAAFDRSWQRQLYDGGWAGLNWPKEHGGRGLSGIEQMIWLEECAKTSGPLASANNIGSSNTTNIGLAMAGPTLIARGNDQQRREHLLPILKGERVWCQAFSEPGAGSDLAAVKTRGEIVGNSLVINGQKMWTSKAQHSDYQVLLIRTDSAAKGHKGLTYVLCDLRSPGLDIRPVKLMSGERTVNLLFYDNVRVPLANVVGNVGEGWSVAMSTLMFERGIAQFPELLGISEKLNVLIEIARKTRQAASGRLFIEDDEIRRRLARLKADVIAIRAMTIASMSQIARAGQPGPGDSSIMKLYISATYKAVTELSASILGWNLFEYGEDRTTNQWTYDFMWSWALTVAGGSNEILREVIADRMLELPRAR